MTSHRVAAALACLGEAYNVGERTGPLWPGWEPAHTPVLIVNGDTGYLAGVKTAPRGFQPVRGWDRPLYHGPAVAAGGANAAVIPAAVLDLEHPRGPAKFAGLILREAFAFHRTGRVPPYPVAIGRYPEASAANNVLSRIEGMILAGLLAGTADGEGRTAFALIRRERRERLDELLVEGEKICELRLGLGFYVEARAFQAAADPRYRPTAAFQTMTGSSPGFSEVVAERLGVLRSMHRQVSRERFAHTGMALALCLDRLLPGWTGALGPATFLDDLFEQAVDFDGGDGDEAVLLRAKEHYGYFDELVAERRRLRDLGARRAEFFASVLNSPGLKLVFDVSALEPAMVTGDRARVEPLQDHTLLYRGACTFRFGPTTLDFEGVHLLEDRRNGLLQVVTRPGRLRFEGDDRSFGLDVPAEFTAGLALDVPGVKVRARQGVMYDADGVLYVKLLG